MNPNKPSVLLLLTVLLMVASSLYLQAQVLPPPAPEGVPLDPLSWLILGAGGVTAGKKYIDNKRKQQ